MQMGANKAAAIINVTPMIDILLVLLIVFMLLPTLGKHVFLLWLQHWEAANLLEIAR